MNAQAIGLLRIRLAQRQRSAQEIKKTLCMFYQCRDIGLRVLMLS